MNRNNQRSIKALLRRKPPALLRGLCANAGIDAASTKTEMVNDLAGHYDSWYDNDYGHVLAAIEDVKHGW